jgi:hypothetical protein
MIHLKNFNEAYLHYQQQKISFRVLQEHVSVMWNVCDKPYQTIANPLHITQSDIDWLLQQEESSQSYDELLGGDVYICETASDLLEIQGYDLDWAEAHDGRWPNVTDKPMTWDVCEYLEEAIGNPQWVIFMQCWTNAGGSIYYVPQHLWMQARVAEHIAATN